MVENRLDSTFHAPADPTRRGMLANLALGEKSIGELAEPFRMSLAGASKHVKVLEEAGLLKRRKVGRTHFIRLEARPLAEAERWMHWQLPQWPVVLEDNGDVHEATGEIDRVVFPPRDPACPGDAMEWNHHDSGFEARMYGEPVSAELQALAARLAAKAGRRGPSA